MKRIIYLFLLTVFVFGFSQLKSQDVLIRGKISYINSLLKANPFVDIFNEITFFYSVDITTDKELVVNMEFNGPFKSLMKSAIAELDRSLPEDTIYGSSSICWYCRPGVKTKGSNCVYNETITTDGEKEHHYSDNICVMFANNIDICYKLDSAFNQLFTKVLESGLKE